ncbi:MAG: nucleotide exchange factor GrpE [Prevotellaceae bacterium]|nr:nucleotide exchange factor GrpE [Prevotellaceae bacterium]
MVEENAEVTDTPVEQEEETPASSCEEKLNALNDTHLRTLAEFDNYRKRTMREKAELLKSASEGVLSGILPLVDDFERGLQAAETATDITAVREGMQLIYDKFIAFLAKNSVKAIDTDNQPFDTEFHEAITTIPAPTEEQKGKIIDCVQKGYTLNDKVIRFAKVVVGE